MLVQTIRSASHVRDEFQQYGRYDQFSYGAYDYLYEYLWDLSEGCGQPIEFDVIAICCEWCEYDSAEELADQYGVLLEDLKEPEEIAEMDEDDIEEALADEMEGRGMLIRMDCGGVLFSE
jgi:hypothetical protein